MSETKERPILFNAEMVKALLDGRKTVTRRPLKSQPPAEFFTGDVAAITNGREWAISISRIDRRGPSVWPLGNEPGLTCPYGQPGDRLIVTEDIRLEVVNVGVERLQDVSRGDCMSEGCPFPNLNSPAVKTDPVRWFSDLWREIYGADDWERNIWVWVIEFRRLEP